MVFYRYFDFENFSKFLEWNLDFKNWPIWFILCDSILFQKGTLISRADFCLFPKRDLFIPHLGVVDFSNATSDFSSEISFSIKNGNLQNNRNIFSKSKWNEQSIFYCYSSNIVRSNRKHAERIFPLVKIPSGSDDAFSILFFMNKG